MDRRGVYRRGAAALAAAMLLVLAAGCGAEEKGSGESPRNPYGLTETVEEGAILHAWCWSFETITESKEDIAWAGFSAIQTSPINS